MEIISVVNQKGGVGKTTTAINLGSSLAEMGKNILYIDLDPQGNLTEGLGQLDEDQLTSFEILKKQADFEEVLISLNYPDSWGRADLIPSNLGLAEAELELSGEIGRELILKSVWNDNFAEKAEERYDYVLIDTNPSLGLLTINAVVLTDSLIIPVEPGVFSYRGMEKLLEISYKIKKKFNNKLQIKGLLFTRVDGRTNIADKYYKEYRENFDSDVFSCYISQNVALNEAQEKGEPINIYKPNARGSKDYMMLAEVIDSGQK